MIVTIFYIKNITAYLSSRLRLVSRKVKLEELRQEMIVTVMCLLSIMTNIGQLASAIIGTGGDTAVLYTFSNRLLLSMTVIALVLPGKRGLKALKDVFSEKFSKLVTGRFASNRSIDNL